MENDEDFKESDNDSLKKKKVSISEEVLEHIDEIVDDSPLADTVDQQICETSKDW